MGPPGKDAGHDRKYATEDTSGQDAGFVELGPLSGEPAAPGENADHHVPRRRKCLF
jgi:hypothetical protein